MGKKARKSFVSPENYVTEDNIGKRVVAEKKGNGVLKWIGEADWGKGKQLYCGIELDDVIDGNEGNGSVMGITYFTCEVGKGIFLSVKRVALDPTQPTPTNSFLASIGEIDSESVSDESKAQPVHTLFKESASRNDLESTSDNVCAAPVESSALPLDADFADVEPTEEDVQACLEEIQKRFMSEMSGEDSKHLKRKQEISAGSASKKKSDWVPQYLKTINDEKAMSKFLDRSTLSHVQLEKLQEAEKQAGAMAKQRAVDRLKRARDEQMLAEQQKRDEEEKQRRIAKEREEREAKDRAEREARALAKEQAAREAREEAEREAKVQVEREAKEAAARAEQQRKDREERERLEKEAIAAHERAETEARERAEREERTRKEQELREAQEQAAERRRQEMAAAEQAVRDAQQLAAQEAAAAREALAQQLKAEAEEHARQQRQRDIEAQAAQKTRDDTYREQLRKEMLDLVGSEIAKAMDATVNGQVDQRIAVGVASALREQRVNSPEGTDASKSASADVIAALTAKIQALEKTVSDMQASMEAIQSWENQLVRINLKLSDHDSRLAALERDVSANASGSGALNGENAPNAKKGSISRDNRLTFKKGRKSLVSVAGNSSDDSDDSDDDTGNVSVRARTMSLVGGVGDGKAPSLDNTGRRVTLVQGQTTAGPVALDNTGSTMILDPNHPDYEGQNTKRAGDLKSFRGASDASQANADFEGQMSAHEKRLREEEFDAQRKAEAKKKFLSKFGKHTST